MADIFISYSSKDREKAEQLTELLSSAGLSVWIDQSALEVSTSWSAEIVDAISSCSAFIVLLSPNSIESHNVIKEVSLASEKRKKILPLDLEPITLPRELEYQLAGIHRTSMTNIDSIIRALGKLGLEATQAPTLKLIKETDSRKSLMILPFEDLSPTADNQWFADGIVSELINALSNVKALRTMDAQTTKEFKKYNGHLTTYAKEMGIRYFVQGDVRKFGDQIKISSRLLDIETGDHLWQDSLKGTMEDIFDIQETVAKNVVEGLTLHLASDEKKKLGQRGTENTEAYEFYLKGLEYYQQNSRIGYERALQCTKEATRLDTEFGLAHVAISKTYVAYYFNYSRDSQLLEQATTHLDQAEAILGESANIYTVRGFLACARGDFEGAVSLTKLSIAADPEYSYGYDVLAHACSALGRGEEAVEAARKYVELRGNAVTPLYNYLVTIHSLRNSQRLAEASRAALPYFERHLRFTPDDILGSMQYTSALQWAGESEAALRRADELVASDGIDGFILYSIAGVFLHEGKPQRAMQILRQSIQNGYRDLELFKEDYDLDPLRGTAEFEELMKELEEKIEKEKND